MLELEPFQISILVLVEQFETLNDFVEKGLLVEASEWMRWYWEMRMRNSRKSMVPLRSSSTRLVKI